MPQVSSTDSSFDEPDDAPAPSSGTPQSQKDAVDALLDEIDGTLQKNAERFVRSFVQKGGE